MEKMDNDIVFALNSVVSEEEQERILASIEEIYDRRCFSPEGAGGEAAVFKAAKKGFALPLAVNIAAFVLLAAGVIAIARFHGYMEGYLVEMTAAVGGTERLLIEEIRRETALVLAAQDAEISLVVSRMQEIEAELARLQSEGVEVSADLLAEQQAFQLSLTALQDERAMTLEQSRLAETMLRTIPDSMANGFIPTAADLAFEAMALEMQQEMALEAHLSGGISMLNSLISQNRFYEVAPALNNLRAFLASSTFSSARSPALRQELYYLTFNSLEAILYEAGLGEEGQARRLAEIEEAFAALAAQNQALQATVNALAADRDGLNNTLAARDNTIREQSLMIISLRNALFGWGF